MNKIKDQVQKQLLAGEAVAKVIVELCAKGYSKVDSIDILMDSGVDYAEAKMSVHNSDAWKEVRKRDEQFHEEMAISLSTSQADQK